LVTAIHDMDLRGVGSCSIEIHFMLCYIGDLLSFRI